MYKRLVVPFFSRWLPQSTQVTDYSFSSWTFVTYTSKRPNISQVLQEEEVFSMNSSDVVEYERLCNIFANCRTVIFLYNGYHLFMECV